MIKQSIVTLLTGSILLLGYKTPVKCGELCTQSINISDSYLTKIYDNIYVSKKGKFYEKIDCKIHLTQHQIDEYLKLKKAEKHFLKIQNEHKITLHRWRRYFNNLDKNTINNELLIQIAELIQGYRIYYDPGRMGITSMPQKYIFNENDIKKKSQIIKSQYPEMEKIIEDIAKTQIALINTSNKLETIKLEIYNIEPEIINIKPNVLEKKIISLLDQRRLSYQRIPRSRRIILDKFNETEISPVYYKKFIELNRKLTLEEGLELKKYLLALISDKLSKKYGENYQLLENNNSILRTKVNNLNREITDSSWEKLELTITPIIVSTTQIDVSIAAVLFTKSGFTIIPPSKEAIYEHSNNYKALEEYISKLITYLKRKIPISDFKLEK